MRDSIRKYINMSENIVLMKRYGNGESKFPINETEIWRYAGYQGVPDKQEEELRECLDEVIKDLKDKLSYKVCYRKMPLHWENNKPQLPFMFCSNDLVNLLTGCDEVIIFAATIGLEVDRYIARCQRTSVTKALLAQAYGTERIECLCDVFCKEMEERAAVEQRLCTVRFSPGYGDVSLELQKDFFEVLDCSRQIGVCLNESLLMTPSKSVTAIFGVGSEKFCTEDKSTHKCDRCKNRECNYRKRCENI